jgi:protein-tyrosine phosphatase
VIDTHSHLLPGLDHGCPDLETSVLMAAAAADSGVDTIICTPHMPDWDEPLVARAAEVIEQVRAALAVGGVKVRLLLGFEVDLSIAATVNPDRLRGLAIEGFGEDQPPRPAILLETPYTGWPLYMEDTIFRLSAAGFVPVLAHPERNERVQASPDLLRECLKSGAVAQATAGSLGGDFGRPAAKAFYRLLDAGLISLLASDAHAHRRDGWTVAPMLQSLAGRLSAEKVSILTETNPRRLLEGKPMLPVGGEAPPSRRGRRSRFG